MSRLLFIILVVSFVVLLAVTLYRFAASSDGDDRRPTPIGRGMHSDRPQPPASQQRADASGGTFHRDQIPSSAGAPARNRIESSEHDDERNEGPGKGGAIARDHSRAAAVYGSADRRDLAGEHGALPAGNALGAAVRREAMNGAGGEDSRFHAVAEQLADAGRQSPAAEAGEEEATDDLVHEPPTKAIVDDSMTYTSGDYRFSLDSPFQIPHTGDAGTVALWLQPEWSADDQEDAAVIQLGDGNFQVYKNVNVLRFEVNTDSPEHSASYSIAGWQAGEWHAITASWADGQVTFYVDGQPVGKPIKAAFKPDGETRVTIGTIAAADQPVAPATVSDVSLRNRGLSAEEILKLYNRSALVPRSQ